MNIGPQSKTRDRRGLSVQVREQLEAMIRAGTFPTGTKLPREEELTELLEVSRPTLREALKSMETDGLVMRKRGIGTFVYSAEPLRSNLGLNFGVTDLIREHNRRSGSHSVTATAFAAEENEAQLLQVPIGEPLIRLERIRTADDNPVVFSVDTLTRSTANTAKVDSIVTGSEQSLYSVLRRSGIKIHHGVAWVQPISADPALAAKLCIAEGAPVLLLNQTDYDETGQPILHCLEYHPPDAFEVTIYRRGPD